MSVCAILCGYCAEGQDAPQNPPAPTSPSSGTSSSSSAPKAKADRWISGGVTLSVLGLSSIKDASSTINNSATVSTQYQTKGASQRIGYGATIQGRITEHFFVNVSGLVRHLGYTMDTTVSTTTTNTLNGISFPVTSSTGTHEDTRTRLIEVPFVLRYYGLGKRPGSVRWFLEAGGAWRTANNIRTSVDGTDASGNLSCCTFTPAVPKNKSDAGIVAGVGLQLVDEFGIHVVPEVRYTRWRSPIFDNLTTHTQANQVEINISLTF